MKGALRGAGAIAKTPIGFIRGVSYPLRGARFVYLQHPGLAKYWVVPILITAVALIGVIYGVAVYHDDAGSAVWSLFPEEWGRSGGWTDKLVGILRGFIQVLVAIALVLAGLVLVVVSSTIIAAPFNDMLSEAVEVIVTEHEAPRFSWLRMLRDVGRTVSLEILKVLVYLVVVGPLFIGSFLLPFVGQIMTIVAFVLTILYLGVDYVDWPAARRDWTIGDRVRFARRCFAAIAGFGTGVWVLLFIPLVNLLFMPAAVAGGTLLFLELEPSSDDP